MAAAIIVDHGDATLSDAEITVGDVGNPPRHDENVAERAKSTPSHTAWTRDPTEMTVGRTGIAVLDAAKTVTHTEIALGHTEIVVGRTEIILGPAERHTELTLGHTELTLAHTGITLEHTEITLGHTGITRGPNEITLGHT